MLENKKGEHDLKFSMERRKIIFGYIFISPFILGFLIFFAFPLYLSIRLSVGRIARFADILINFSGFEHYIKAFVYDATFIPILLNVISQVTIRLPLIITFSLLISILINKDIELKGFFRTAAFLPFLLGTGHVMEQLLGIGISNTALSAARGIIVPREVVVYLGQGVAQTIDLVLNEITIILWKTGVQVLLFLSGLQAIPISLYESAKIDSATEWEMFWKITLPMISPILLLNVVYTIVDSFLDISNPILTYIKKVSFDSLQFEYGAALGWIYFILILLIIGIVFSVFKNYVMNTSQERRVKK